MNELQRKQLCLRLLSAESEREVDDIVASIPEMQDSKNWLPLDKRETNFNVTSNQASDGGKALTELMTNMVDAVLLKHARLAGIDPKGPTAPKTMYEAVDRLVKPIHGGKLINLGSDDAWLRDFAESNLVIGVTGAKSKKAGLPCYTFVDNGEGQAPEKFEDTFLSLSKGNKKDIAFVQGKFNMGSSGVLGYCGFHWYKLIVSRRYDKKSPWGFTLMRRRPGRGMPIAEYFVLPTEDIPSFEEKALYPFNTSSQEKYEKIALETGTIIKLYDYQIGTKFASGFRGSREALIENLVETILPFRILDFRQAPDRKRTGDRALGIDPRPFYGMEFLLVRSAKETSETDDEDTEAADGETIDVGSIKDPEMGKISVRAIPLKRDIPGWLQKSNSRVFHSVNGQVQFKQTRGYLSMSCGFPALKDRVVIIADASELSFEAHNDIWKGDREHIRNTIVGERYQQLVTEIIKDSGALRDLQQKVAREELQQAAKTERNDLFQKLVDSDPNLAKLLNDKDPVIYVPAGGGENDNPEPGNAFEGKYSPTFLQFDKKAREFGVEIPINKSKPVSATTDAENGYFQRAENPGQVLIDEEISSKFRYRYWLKNGRISFVFELLDGAAQVGDEFEVRIGLFDPSMPQAVEDTIKIRIAEPAIAVPKPPRPPSPEPPGTPPNHGKSSNGNKKNGNDRRPTLGLPPYRLMTKDGRKQGQDDTQKWPEGFDENDGGFIEDLGEEGSVYKINYDNAYHLKYRMSQKGDTARNVVTEKYILGMRILMLGFERALRLLKEAGDGSSSKVAEVEAEFRRMAAKGAASTVLALAENLPRIVDKAAVESAQDAE